MNFSSWTAVLQFVYIHAVQIYIELYGYLTFSVKRQKLTERCIGTCTIDCTNCKKLFSASFKDLVVSVIFFIGVVHL